MEGIRDEEGTFGNRNAAFGSGAYPQSLTVASYRQNAAVSRIFSPDSVLNPVLPSGNGLSPKDSARRVFGGGFIPTANGYSSGSYERSRPLLNPYTSVS